MTQEHGRAHVGAGMIPTRESLRGRRIRGTWPDGHTATATWSDYDEWYDDRFGQEFGLSQAVIGKPEHVVKAETSGGWWNGCIRVEWLDDDRD